MDENIVMKLTSKNDKYACAIADKIIAESQETDEWYKYFDDFASLLDYPKSLVRNRILYILAANAQWDEENRFDLIISDFLSHITDEKPITARQCIKALAQVGKVKTKYIPQILSALHSADLSKYKDSMRPLIEKDIAETEKILTMREVLIKPITTDNFEGALSLVWKVFQEYEAPDYSPEGINEFYKSIHDEKYLSMLSMFGAFINEQLIGVIATRNEGAHIALFFVDGKYQRKGIGRRLFNSLLENNAVSKLTVNSSPFAIPVYHKLGFCDTDKEQTVNGLRFTPMVYEV